MRAGPGWPLPCWRSWVNNVALVAYPNEPDSVSCASTWCPSRRSSSGSSSSPLNEPLTGDDLQRVANRLSDSLSGLNCQEILAKTKDVSPFERAVTESVTDISDHYIEGL